MLKIKSTNGGKMKFKLVENLDSNETNKPFFKVVIDGKYHICLTRRDFMYMLESRGVKAPISIDIELI